MIQFKKYNFNKHRLAHLNGHDINLLSDISNSDIDDMQLQTKSINNKVNGQSIVIIRSILNNHQFVNLGLPSGTLWATCNVGAKVDKNPGKYFSWNNLKGNTDDKFKLLDTAVENCPSPNETLSLDNDAARIHMGGKWHMPTVEQLQELYRNTTKKYIEDTKHRRYGILLTGPNGNSIFLPETGFMDDAGICDGWESMILSNTSGDDAGDVCYGYFDINFEGVANDLNYGYGAPTRGVIDKNDWQPLKKYIDIDQIYENSNSSKSKSIQESKNKSGIEKKYVDAVINESYEESYSHLSDILADIIYNESFEEYGWSAFTSGYSNGGVRRKLIDGFCMEVCMFISSHYNIPEIEYYMLDDKGDAYHFLMKYENKWYDAYNYTGVDKLKDLEFVHMYMSKYDENQLHTYLQLVSEGSFDYKRAMELIREGCK